MQADIELETWQRQWQTRETIPPDLRQRVERAIRARRLGFAASIAVTVIFGLGVPAWAIVSQRADVVVLAAAVWLFIVITWMVSMNLERGLSEPMSSTTAAFLDYSILLCQRRRSGIAAGSVLYVAMAAFNLGWTYQARTEPVALWSFLTSGVVASFWVITAILAVAAVWSRRRLDAELRTLRTLRRQLETR